MRRFRSVLALAPLLALSAVVGAAPEARAFSLINGSFEQPVNSGGCTGTPPWICYVPQVAVTGWKTTAVAGIIEIWRDTPANGSIPLAYEGNQYAELNYLTADTLFQDVASIPAGSLVGYELAHRARNSGIDVMALTITDLGTDNAPGGAADTVLFARQFSSGNTAWSFYSQGNVATTLGNTVRFAYTAVSTANGNLSEGNFIDAVAFGVGVGSNPVPAPLPILGAGAAFGFSRRVRRRLRSKV